MRALALGVLVLAAPLVGCLGDSDALSLPLPAQLPLGLKLTYEIARDGDTSTNTFVVMPDATGTRYDLLPHRVTGADLESPFMKLGHQLTPRDPDWTGLITFPLVEGASYEAEAAGEDVTVTVSSAGEVSGQWGSSRALRLSALDQQGNEVARLTILEEPLVLAGIEIDAPDGRGERWTLVDWEVDPGWNNVPRWEIGRWWSYDAFSLAAASNLTLIYNAEGTAMGGNPVAVLNAQHLSERLVATPFHSIRRSDLSSQSGILNNVLSRQWTWPLYDGARWGGSTNDGGLDEAYTAVAAVDPRFELPDGTITTSFEITAFTRDGDGVGAWNYVPLIEHFSHLTVRGARDGRVLLDWRLTDWGTGFVGDIELPQRTQLYNSTITPGPLSVSDAFEVDERPETIEVRGTAVRSEAGAPTGVLRVLAPDGTVVFERTAEDFAASQVVSLVDVIDARPGTWRFEAETPKGTSYFVEVIGHWGNVQAFDYS